MKYIKIKRYLKKKKLYIKKTMNYNLYYFIFYLLLTAAKVRLRNLLAAY